MDYSFDWKIIKGGVPFVTFSRLGIGLNDVAVKKMGSPEKVIIGFDEEKKAVGIRAYDESNEKQSYELARRVKQGWARFGCKEIIRYISLKAKIDFYKTKKYAAEFDSSTKILIVDLRKKSTCVARERTKAKK